MPLCEKNILEIPPRLALPDPTDLVIITDTAGNSFITPWSVLNAALNPKWAIYDATGSEGGIATFPTMANVDFSRVINIYKSGSAYRDIVQVPATGFDVQYESDVTGATVTQPFDFAPGDWIKVCYV